MIFMDIMMPKLNGWDATRRIRSMKRSDAGNVPIIAMSANAYAEDVKKCLDSGMNAHISKPLFKDVMLRTIARLYKSAGDHAMRSRHNKETANMKKAVIFDLDGLLIDSEVISHRLYDELLHRYGKSVTVAEYARDYSGKTGVANMTNVIARYNLPITVEEGLT